MAICTLCGNSFIQDRNRSRCGSCNTKIRRYRTKMAAITYLGGKCEKCGWKGNQAVFQFHHKNPAKKNFNLGNVSNKSWDTVKQEIKKCTLLCANCHMIEHSKRNEKAFLEEAQKYKGKLLEI